MDNIQFQNVVPHVFQSRDNSDSEIWGKDVTFQKGHLYLLESASGRGKSTFCSYLLGYRNDYSGQVLFDGHDTRAFRTSQWTDVRKSHVSLLFQELRLFPELTAWENVEIKNRLTSHTAAETIRHWFDMLGIGDKKDALIGEMSYGQQQRVAIARAIAQAPPVILADEPTGNLDSASSMEILDILKQLHAENRTVILITHDNDIAKQAKRVIRIKDGKIERDYENE